MLYKTILPSVLLLFLVLACTCTETVQQGEWKNLTFMDSKNITHKISVKLSNAVYDNQSGYLRVDGAVKNRMKEDRYFDVKNWVYRLNQEGQFLKPQSVGLPTIKLQAMNNDGTSREEKFSLIYKIQNNGTITDIILDYADHFFMTGQINRIIIAVPLHVSSGTVTSRG